MDIDTTKKTTKEFPFYYTTYVDGQVVGCTKNSRIRCTKCMCRTFCSCKEE